MIHQVLYGYADGHNLLAASTSLTREQRSTLARRTDLSGPAPIAGFDGYVSGFALDDQYYVLSQTWYAHELSRLGCVWTHGLLLDQEVIEESNVLSVLALLKRPHANDFSAYERPVIRDASLSRAVSRVAVEPVLNAVYSEANRNVYCLADSVGEVNSVFVALWNQQWPSLRRKFSFTTGLLGTNTHKYVLSAVPIQNRRLLKDDETAIVVSDRSTLSGALGFKAAVSDCCSEKPTALREFLWKFGPDAQDERRAFKGLCEVYEAREQSARDAMAVYAEVLRQLGPSPLARNVAGAFFGDPRGQWAMDDTSVVYVMIRDEVGENIIGADDGFRLRLEALSDRDLVSVAAVALEAEESKVARTEKSRRLEMLVDVLADGCGSSVLATLSAPLVALLLKRRSELARLPEAWSRPASDSHWIVRRLRDDHALRTEIIVGLLFHGDVELLLEAMPAESWTWAEASRDFVDRCTVVVPEVESLILRRLAMSPRDVWNQLFVHTFGPFIKFAAAVCCADNHETMSLPLSQFNAAAVLPRLHDHHADLSANAFLFAVGMAQDHPASSSLVAQTFHAVYQAALEGAMSWDEWRRVEHELPWHFFEWDRCARLIEGSVSRFVYRGWPRRDFLRAYRTDEQFDRAVSEVVRLGRSDYFHGVDSDLSIRDVVSPWQLARLKQVKF